ncbi:hypothetical protein J4732_05335, partial [Serratia marcescens]|nr:hypothetical protein [Serratia marcescens]
ATCRVHRWYCRLPTSTAAAPPPAVSRRRRRQPEQSLHHRHGGSYYYLISAMASPQGEINTSATLNIIYPLRLGLGIPVQPASAHRCSVGVENMRAGALLA